MTSNSSGLSGTGGEQVIAPSSSPNGNKNVKLSDDSEDNGIIAVSVVVPLIALVLILVGGYYWYRRKYPVRMIIGRDVSKFTNPKYAPSNRQAALVRNDAENYFNQPNDELEYSDTITLEMNPASARWQPYDNPGYQRDVVDDIAISGVNNYDDDEEERKFREKKSWLFRRSEDKGNVEKSNGNAEDVESISTSHSEIDHSDKKKLTDSQTGKIDYVKHFTDENSLNSDVSELLNEQQVTPRRPRRGLSKEITTESSSTTESVVSSHSITVNEETNVSESVAQESDSQNDKEGNKSSVLKLSEDNQSDEKEESNFMKTAKKIFEQPSLEQVIAEVKARSRSMSIDTLKIDLHPRQRSYSVDPSKSARKSSLHDDTILTAFAKSVAAPKIFETPISSASSHHSMNSSKQPLTAQSSLSASIVGVDIKVKLSSDGSVSGGSSLSLHSNDGSDIEERHRGLSIASVNSNPRNITDLDNNNSHNSELEPPKIEDDSDSKCPEEDVHKNADGARWSDNNDLQPENSIENIDSVEQRAPKLSESKESIEDNDRNRLDPAKSIEFIHGKLEGVKSVPGVLEMNALEEIEYFMTPENKPVVIEDNKVCSIGASLIPDSIDGTGVVDNANLQAIDLDTNSDNRSISSSDSKKEKEEEILHCEKQVGIETTDDYPKSFPESNLLTGVNFDPQYQIKNKPQVSSEGVFKSKEQFSEEQYAILSLVEDNSMLQEKIMKGEEENSDRAVTEAKEQIREQAPQDLNFVVQKAENLIAIKPVPAPMSQSVVEEAQSTSDDEPSDDDSSGTSESNESWTKVSYDFAEDRGNGKEENEDQEEISSLEDENYDSEAQSLAQNVDSGAGLEDSMDKSKEHVENFSSELPSGSDYIGSESQHNPGSTSTALGFTDTPAKPTSVASPKRVRILPLAVTISDDDDDDDSDKDDEDNGKYKISDDDISDILGSSSEDNESGDLASKKSFHNKNLRASSPTTYTFQHYDSDEDDIDV